MWRGHKRLTLPPDALASLRGLREAQARAHGPGQIRSGWLCLDDSGEPMRPEAYSDSWARLCKAANVPVLPLHGARHTSVTRMLDAGVQPRIGPCGKGTIRH